MVANRTKWIVVVSLGILLCILGCIGLAEVAPKGSEGQAPIRRLRITIDVSQRDELFAQLRKFAEKHDLEFRLTFYDKDKKIFLVEMLRDDIEIVAVDSPKASTIIRLRLYDKDPTHPTPKETVDEVFTDLKRFINEIPNVTIIEEE